jgi:hypothetical protein
VHYWRQQLGYMLAIADRVCTSCGSGGCTTSNTTQADANSDGQIDFAEFKAIMTGTVGGEQRHKILRLETMTLEF